MQKIKAISAISFVLLAGLSTKIAYGQSLFDRSICDPAQQPTAPNGCGYPEFIILLNNVIDWLIIIGFPLGTLFIAYGGFVILTSAGSTEKVNSGKKIITAAIVAMLIALLSYFIIQAVFGVLGVGGEFRSQSLDQNLELP